MDFLASFESALPYGEFLAKYASPGDRRRWDDFHANVSLSAEQIALLQGFRREMLVLCLAGAWCGDCVNQCPIFDHFARLTPKISLRFLDRDAQPETTKKLSVCGGARVPVVVFMAEDGHQVSWYGDRTLAKYRRMALDQVGPTCSTGLATPADGLQQAVIQEWLDQFERVQLLLRLSARLRQKHGD